MFKENKQYIALVMIVLLAAAMITMFAVNRKRSADGMEAYLSAAERQSALQAEIMRNSDERYARTAALAEDIEAAAHTYLPGVVFYGTNMERFESGSDLPQIVKDLISEYVHSTSTSVVNALEPHITSLQRTYLPVVFLGRDDGWDGDVDTLIAMQKEFIGGHENYIVLGMHTGTREEMAYLEAVMTEEYGDKYINLREYLSTDGMDSLGMTISREDTEAMAEGRTPPGLLDSDGNLNDSGYKLAAFLTYDRMDQLGYFNEVLKAVAAYNAAAASE